MKQFLLSAVVALFTFVAFGQCPSESIIMISSQQQLNQFAIDFPDCTTLESRMSVFGSDITDLSPLNNLTAIGVEIGATGSLSIYDCPNLTSLNGLQNVEFAVELRFNNINITNFSGLENLEEISESFSVVNCDNVIDLTGLNALVETGTVTIGNNDNLVDLNGLQALTIMDGNGQNQLFSNPSMTSLNGLQNLRTIHQDLIINNNEQLQNLDALSGIVNLTGIQIGTNTNLNSISGLSSVDPSTLNTIISISNNPNLSSCDVQFICENLQNQNIIVDFFQNATGCNSIPEVEIECSLVDIPDNNFLDALVNHSPTIDTNSDGNIQFDEAEAFSGTLEVASEVISDFTGLEAFINISAFDGSGNFASELSLEANTELTSVDFSNNPDLYTVFLKNGNNTSITNFNGVDCPSLEFVCVDDVAFAEANFTNIDPQVIFVEDCEVLTVAGFNLAEAVSVFPNPVSEMLTISKASNIKIIRAEIYTIRGQKIMETSASQFNMSDLSAGIYFVKVITELGSTTKKIIKE